MNSLLSLQFESIFQLHLIKCCLLISMVWAELTLFWDWSLLHLIRKIPIEHFYIFKHRLTSNFSGLWYDHAFVGYRILWGLEQCSSIFTIKKKAENFPFFYSNIPGILFKISFFSRVTCTLSIKSGAASK